MELLDVLGGVRKKKEFEVVLGGKNIKVVMQTLTQEEQVEVFGRVANFMNTIHMVTASQVPTLARSIVSIDNIPIEQYSEMQDQIKESEKLYPEKTVDMNLLKEKCFNKLPETLINVFYTKYMTLKNEHVTEIENTIKN